MIEVSEALARVRDGIARRAPVGAEDVSLAAAHGRVLAQDVTARVTQPPTPISAMDGWAVRAADVATTPVELTQVGYVPAGSYHDGAIGPGEAVRLFTGSPVPDGADAVVIQENVEADGARVRVLQGSPAGKHIRRAGLDFTAGDAALTAPRRLTARDLGLAAAMNHAWLSVRRRPRIAILATGSEIVRPGEPIGAAQIVSSNSFALAALIAAAGGEPVQLGISPDDDGTLRRMAAAAEGMDMLVTTGGASVGDHDLIQSSLGKDGLELDFWKIAMRPGKPLIFGRLRGVPLLGLPGNPVSTLVCALLFLKPAIETLLGLPASDAPPVMAKLAEPLAKNDRRQDFLRARWSFDAAGNRLVAPFPLQDSSMVSTLAAANCLLIRKPHAPASAAGDLVEILPFEDGALPV
jgi:molybdopterin molybdotransferase